MPSNTLSLRRSAALALAVSLLVLAGCSAPSQPGAVSAPSSAPSRAPSSTAAPSTPSAASTRLRAQHRRRLRVQVRRPLLLGPRVDRTPRATSSHRARVSQDQRSDIGIHAGATPHTGGRQQHGPGPSATVQETRELDRPSETGTGLAAKLSSIRAINAKAQLPGEIAGPALALTLQVTNAGTKTRRPQFRRRQRCLIPTKLQAGR